MANLEALAEAVDLATLDRKLADEIEKDLEKIRADIAAKGFSEVTVRGKTFRITNENSAAA